MQSSSGRSTDSNTAKALRQFYIVHYCQVAVKLFVACSVCLADAALILTPWINHGAEAVPDDGMVLFGLIERTVMLVALSAIFIYVLPHADTRHARLVTIFIWLMWFIEVCIYLSLNLDDVGPAPDITNGNRSCTVAGRLQKFSYHPWAAAMCIWQHIVVDRARVLQEPVAWDLGGLKHAVRVHYCVACAHLLVVGAALAGDLTDCVLGLGLMFDGWFHERGWMFLCAVQTTLCVTFGWRMVVFFKGPYETLRKMPNLDVARVAVKHLEHQIRSIHLRVFFALQLVVFYFLSTKIPEMWFALSLARHADSIASIAIVLRTMKLGQSESVYLARKHEFMRMQNRREIRYDPKVEQGWDDLVDDLAHRGITLEKLMEFWMKLPQRMPHFDPMRHTTRCVVRQVIIPLTASTGRAYATHMMNEVPTVPMKMVTHTWSNLFRNLVAAVVADAVGDMTYGVSAYLLTHKPAKIIALLDSRNKLQDTYWICAFSVAQHYSICDATYVDKVTGDLVPACTCGRPKYNFMSPPLCDGASIPCEMNKFVDMMAYLASNDEDFQQVVAVDPEFQLFERAWCIAEMAKAHSLYVTQNLKMLMCTSSNQFEKMLRALDVRNLKASRPEDVEYILASIPDHDEFNTRLKELIFNPHIGVYTRWVHSDPRGRMALAGRVISQLGMCGENNATLATMYMVLSSNTREMRDSVNDRRRELEAIGLDRREDFASCIAASLRLFSPATSDESVVGSRRSRRRQNSHTRKMALPGIGEGRSKEARHEDGGIPNMQGFHMDDSVRVVSTGSLDDEGTLRQNGTSDSAMQLILTGGSSFNDALTDLPSLPYASTSSSAACDGIESLAPAPAANNVQEALPEPQCAPTDGPCNGPPAESCPSRVFSI